MTKKKNKTKKLKNNLIKLKDNLFNFIKYNRLFLSYVILSFISCFLLRALTIGNPWDIKANVFDITVIMLFGSLAYFIKPKKQYILFISLLCFYTILNIVNSVYYAFFNSFASFSLLASMGQTAEVTDAVFEKLKVINFVYLIMPIIFIFINKYLKKKNYQYPSTPSLSHMFALDYQLDYILNVEGLENRFKRHIEMADIVRNWGRKYFELFPEEGYLSNTLTTIKNTRGISVADLNKELAKRGFQISNGYGDLKEKTFRIAHMADITVDEVKELLDNINDILGLQ